MTIYYHQNDICITAMGCVLPGSANVQEYWNNLLEAKSQISSITKDRLDTDIYYHAGAPKIDKISSRNSGVIDKSIFENIRRLLDLDESYNNAQLLSLSAFDQAYKMLCECESGSGRNGDKLEKYKCGFAFAMMTPDCDLYDFVIARKEIVEKFETLQIDSDHKKRLISKLDDYLKRYSSRRPFHSNAVYGTSLFEKIKKRYNLSGDDEGMLINAACAGSLAALNVAMMKLHNDNLDIVFTGGINSDLSATLFILFSQMQILAPIQSWPFDFNSKGVTVGEGAVVFALQKVKRALDDGHPILAVIKGIGFSNNGSKSSLFSVSKEQLIYAYESAYASLDSNRIDYLEAHATGTHQGDSAELESINQFWNNVPVVAGSLKGLIGHTQGAAGAASLLKCLLMIKHRIIPPSKYLQKIVAENKNVFINTDPISLDNEKILRMGISSFGFGGSNFHLVIEEFDKNFCFIDKDKTPVSSSLITAAAENTRPAKTLPIILSSAYQTFEECSKFDFVKNFKLSQNEVAQIDLVQLYAILSTDLAIKKLGDFFNFIDKRRVGVIYAGVVGSELYYRNAVGAKLLEIVDLFKDEGNDIVSKVYEVRQTYPFIVPDFGVWALSNVVAGRICQRYNFSGKSYQVDGGLDSIRLGMKIAEWELQNKLDVVIVIHTNFEEEQIPCPSSKVIRLNPKGITTQIISSKNFAKKNALRYEGADSIDLLDFSKVCFIFTTQNAAVPKMFLEQFENNQSIQKYFEDANDFCKRKYGLPNISNYITNPNGISEEDLFQIKNPALFTVAVAIANSLIERGVLPRVLLAHSFGIYPLLVVAGVLKFEDTLDMVVMRDRLSPAPGTLGTMIAVSSIEDVRGILPEDYYYVSNINSYEQTTITVPPQFVNQVVQLLKDNQKYYNILRNVPQPYHSPLMRPVQEEMAKYLKTKKYQMSAPKFPFVSYVGNHYVDESNWNEDLIKDILLQQTTAQVDFVKMVKDIYEKRIATFVEISPKNICANFVLSILKEKEHSIIAVTHFLSRKKSDDGTGLAIKYSITAENSVFFNKIRQIIHRISGHNLENISIQDRFQDDLNIDSIKMAEVFVNISKEYEIDDEDFFAHNFKSIGEAVHFVKNWYEKKSSGDLSTLEKNKYKSKFNRFRISWKGKEKISLNDGDAAITQIPHIVDISKKDFKLAEITIIDALRIEKSVFAKDLFFKIVSEMATAKEDERSLKKITIVYNDEYNPLIQGLITFFGSLKFERNFLFKSILLPDCRELNNELINLVLEEANYPIDRDVAYLNHKRLVRGLVKSEIKTTSAPLGIYNQIVALGGSKGITFFLLDKLFNSKNSSLCLVGRSSADNPQVKNAIFELAKKFRHVEYVEGDTTDWDTFNKLATKFSQIDLLINGVGIEKSALLKDKTSKEIELELNTKVLTMLNIIKACESINIKRVENFSSIVALYTQGGQTIYGAANAIMSTLAHQIKDVSPTTYFQNIYWPAWNNLGMTANEGISAKISQSGLSLLDSIDAVKFFNKELNEKTEVEISYSDVHDRGLFQLNTHNLKYFEKLLGIKSRDNLYQFNKVFTVDGDNYLNGHMIRGNCIVAMATVVSMICCDFYLQTGMLPKIENLVAHKMIKLNDNVNIRFSSQKSDRGPIFFLKDNDSIYFSGGTEVFKVKEIDNPTKLVNLVHLLNLKTKTSLSKDEIYEKCLPHNGVFKCLDGIDIKEEREGKTEGGIRFLAYINDTKKLSPIHNLGIFDKIILLVDAILQANGVLAITAFGIDSFPVEIETLNFHFANIVADNILPSKVYMTNFSSKIDENHFQSKLCMFNEKNDLLIELRVKCQVIKE
ncbi:MAG: SDR family NAD(P)-dependent oxidoreductase [Oligoflexia bacterium]|nr:SDR family NAD(P)-dependent oxidoreductase [Oligoflexia bacterium]